MRFDERTDVLVIDELAILDKKCMPAKFAGKANGMRDDGDLHPTVSQDANGLLDFGGSGWIESRSGFIQKDGLGLSAEGAGKGDTLLLATG